MTLRFKTDVTIQGSLTVNSGNPLTTPGLFFDKSTNRLGLLTSSPQASFHISGGNERITGTTAGTGQLAVSPVSSINNHPYSFVADKAATNLVVNPSFEIDTTGWAASGANAGIARVTTQHWVGDAALQVLVTPAAINQGALSSSMTVTAGQTYVLSARVKGNAGGEIIRLRITGNVSGNTNYNYTLSTNWQTFTLAVAMGGSDTSATVAILTGTSAAITYFIDGIQFEIDQGGTGQFSSYIDGSLGEGYSWSSIAHNSISTRTEGLHFLGNLDNTVYFSFFSMDRFGQINSDRLIFVSSMGSKNSGAFLPSSFGFEFFSDKDTLNLVGVPGGTVNITNTGNGAALSITSGSTSDVGVVIDGSANTTGTIFAIASASDPTNMISGGGLYFKFLNKANISDFAWSPLFSQVSASNNVNAKDHYFYNGGKYYSTTTAGAGTVTQALLAVTGSGTAFTSLFAVGDIYVPTGVGKVPAVITAIASNTAMTVSVSQTVVAGSAYGRADTSYSASNIFFEAPGSDHKTAKVANLCYDIFMDGNGHLRNLMPGVIAGTSTLTTTNGSTAFTTAVNDTGIIAGRWVFATGMGPRQVLSYAAGAGVFRTNADASLVALAYRIRRHDIFATPTGDTDANAIYFNYDVYKETAGKTLTNDQTEQSWFNTTPIIVGGEFSDKRTLHIRAWGTSTAANILATLIIRVKLGGTTILNNATAVTVGSTAAQAFSFESTIQANGTANQNDLYVFRAQTDAAAPVAITVMDVSQTTVNTAQDMVLDISSQFGTNNGQIVIYGIEAYWE